METWRERIADSLFEFFNGIGIHPIIGTAIIITPLVFLRLRKIKEFESQESWEKMYDIAFYLGALSIYIWALFILF